ncbi:MAG: acyltransferase [Oscillospiraceae bacterium]|nr:acyltransferase [Oscillospiraceae bacterium]
MVITIHFGQHGSSDAFTAIRRFVVPFFIIVTGYFVFDSDKEKQTTKLASLFKKMLWLNMIWGLIYLIPHVILNDNGNFLKYITRFSISYNNIMKQTPIFMGYEHYHLWYITALVVASGVLYMLSKYISKKAFTIILHFLPLLLIQCFLVFRLKFFYNIGVNAFDYRNAWFFTLPFLAIGMLIKRYYKETNFGIIILLLLVPPLWFYNTLEIRKELEFSISGSLIAVVLFLISITKYNGLIQNKIAIECAKIAGGASAFIFFAHILLVNYVLRPLQQESNYIIQSFTILFIIYLIYYIIKKYLMNRIQLRK